MNKRSIVIAAILLIVPAIVTLAPSLFAKSIVEEPVICTPTLDERVRVLETDTPTLQEFRNLRRWVKYMQDDVNELKEIHGIGE